MLPNRGFREEQNLRQTRRGAGELPRSRKSVIIPSKWPECLQNRESLGRSTPPPPKVAGCPAIIMEGERCLLIERKEGENRDPTTPRTPTGIGTRDLARIRANLRMVISAYDRCWLCRKSTQREDHEEDVMVDHDGNKWSHFCARE